MPGSCWTPPAATPTPKSPGVGAWPLTRSACGAAGTPMTASRGWPTDADPDARRASPRHRPPRSRPWPASCQPKQGYRYRGGAARTLPARSPAGHRAGNVASTVRRILAADTIKPWQYRSWLFIRDPDFAAKATRVLDLYARVFDGSPLGDGEYVISSDEKTSIQARCRCHPTLPPGASRKMRVNHEYERGGALAYLAAYDVHRARVIGLCSDATGIGPFTDLVDEVMTQEPYASARRVFWIVDNGSSHRGQAAIDRLAARYPNAVMVHTPVHASWLNQVEIFFSIVQRKVVSPNDFTDLDQVQYRLTAFEQRYNATARPFKWKFTPADLEDLLPGSNGTNRKTNQQLEHDHQPAALAAA